jgi:acyl-CoA thioesterase
MAPHPFEESLALTGEAGDYEVTVDHKWEAQPGTVYGGFLVGVALRAAGMVSTAAQPVSVASQFLRPAMIGKPLQIAARSVRRGRSSDLVAVSITQDAKPVLDAQVRAANAGPGPQLEPRQRPRLTDPVSLPPDVSFFAHMESRQARADIPSDGDADLSWWMRLGPDVVYDDAFLEAARFMLSMDSQAPAILNRIGASWGHPGRPLPWGFRNLDMLVHIHRPQATEWVLSDSRVIVGVDGLASAQTQVWSSAGYLMATGISQVAFFEMAA